jgi:hypothetical protein
MKQTHWFTLKAYLAGPAPSPLSVQEHRYGMYAGPHMRLAGFNGVDHLKSRELAEDFAEVLKPIFERRYAPDSASKLRIDRECIRCANSASQNAQIPSPTIR